MSNVNVTFVHGDDWIGMYVDSVLMAQGHSLDECEVVRLLAQGASLELDIDSRYDWNPDQDGGRLPEKLWTVSFQ